MTASGVRNCYPLLGGVTEVLFEVKLILSAAGFYEIKLFSAGKVCSFFRILESKLWSWYNFSL